MSDEAPPLPNPTGYVIDAPATSPQRTRIVSANRDVRQAEISAWARDAFGVEQATSLPQRGIRLLEETIELYQAVGGDPAMAHKLIDFVFSRPVGEVRQELGGIGVCLLVFAQAAGVSAEYCEEAEVDRIKSKPTAHFTARNAAKNAAGFLTPEPASPPQKDLVENRVRCDPYGFRKIFIILPPTRDGMSEDDAARAWAFEHADRMQFMFRVARGRVYAWEIDRSSNTHELLREANIPCVVQTVEFHTWLATFDLPAFLDSDNQRAKAMAAVADELDAYSVEIDKTNPFNGSPSSDMQTVLSNYTRKLAGMVRKVTQ